MKACARDLLVFWLPALILLTLISLYGCACQQPPAPGPGQPQQSSLPTPYRTSVSVYGTIPHPSISCNSR